MGFGSFRKTAGSLHTELNMQDFEKLGAFYLGRIHDASARETRKDPLLYDSKDLVTHAVCVGMTGSGKTGLCIALLEEAAIDGIPAIIIDPKGDLANLLLQFPELRPEDFAPWINEEEARQNGLSTAQFAARQAQKWSEGLAGWDQDGERIRKLRDAADFAIYTPGSTAGLPLSLLKSFAPAPGAASEDPELLRDRIAGTATAVLSLLGIDAEPLSSREHILLSNIFDHAWRGNRALTLEDLIHAIQSPPVDRIGVLDLEAFYPAKDRFRLAMSLNNLLASPGFEAWLEGESLDIGRLLYTPEGKPRHSILSIAHLNDAERMFFVTLVLNEMLAWTRTQSGTTSLRALLYMDEIFGYFPPVANPPSKRPLLTLLKQARAFGVGVVLATQNPVDLDYKGLANAGTWLIGRLQTERDKQRLMEGLEGASVESGARFDRTGMEQTLAGLGNRLFLMNNVHEDAPVLFESRWALSYLRGPLTRTEIRSLMEPRKTSQAPAPAAASVAGPRSQIVSQRPVLPPDIPQPFVPVSGAADRILYRPALIGAVQVRFTDAKAKIDYLKDTVLLTPIEDDSLPVQWEECIETDIDPSELANTPVPEAEYAAVPAAAASSRAYTGWKKDLVAWILQHQQLTIWRSPSLKLCSQPNESEGEFRVRLQQLAREERDRRIETIRQKHASKLAALQERLRRAEQALQREREQSRYQAVDAVVSVGAGVFGALFGRKRMTTAASTAIRSAGRARKESGDIDRAEENVEAVRQQLAELHYRLEEEVHSVAAGLNSQEEALDSVSIKPKRTNVSVRLFTFAWAPYRKDSSGTFQRAWQ
jgi:hypothetical protein